MIVRDAAVAGRFYEGSPEACKTHIQSMAEEAEVPAGLPERIVAGVVPHAGWMFSGTVAAAVFKAIRQNRSVDTFVIFGAMHTMHADGGLIFDRGAWQTPLGNISVDEELAREILEESGGLILAKPQAHQREHSIEVQVPMIQYFFPDARIVPVLVPPVANAANIGRRAARAVTARTEEIVCLGSTDLTHYGPSYGFTPMGRGAKALAWAKNENDALFLKLTLGMKEENIVESASLYGSACGAGAVAATVAAAKEMGAKKGVLLDHTTSAEILQKKFHQASEDSVGYAGMVFG